VILASKAQFSEDDIKRDVALYYIRGRDDDEGDRDSEIGDDLKNDDDNDDDDSLSRSIESTGKRQCRYNHVAPPLPSSLINVVPVRSLADLSKHEFQEEARERVQQTLELKKRMTGSEELPAVVWESP
jgi:hypothetical protein